MNIRVATSALVMGALAACDLFGLGRNSWEGDWYWTGGSTSTDCGAGATTQGANQEINTLRAENDDETVISVSSQTPACLDTFAVVGNEANVRSTSNCRSSASITWATNRLTLSADKATLTWVRDGTYGTCRLQGTTTLTRSAGGAGGSGGAGGTGGSSGGTFRATFSNIAGGAQTQGDVFETTNVRCYCYSGCADFHISAEESPAGTKRSGVLRMFGGPPDAGTSYAFGTSLDTPATAQFIDRRPFNATTGTRGWDTRSLFVAGPRGSLIFDSLNISAGTASFRGVAAIMARTDPPTAGTFTMDVTGTCTRIDMQ